MSNTRMVDTRRESYDVYIERAGQGKDGYFGNPFRLKAMMIGDDTLGRYKKYFHYRLNTDERFRRRIRKLQGKTLGCFCKPNPCRGDIIEGYLERMGGCTGEIAIKKTYWKGVAYPARKVRAGNDIFRVLVESLRDELMNGMHNSIYEAMEASEGVDGYCTDEELCILIGDDLYRMYC